MTIRALQICKQEDPCEKWELKAYHKLECNRVNFFSKVIPAGQNVVGYSWDFGDGNHSNDANPVHFYNATGSYEVVLTV